MKKFKKLLVHQTYASIINSISGPVFQQYLKKYFFKCDQNFTNFSEPSHFFRKEDKRYKILQKIPIILNSSLSLHSFFHSFIPGL